MVPVGQAVYLILRHFSFLLPMHGIDFEVSNPLAPRGFS
jgi:hypothetical protein